MKFLLLFIWICKQIKEKYQNGCHLKSNDHILEAYVHIHVKDEVSVANFMDRRAKKKEKYQNVSHLKTVSQID